MKLLPTPRRGACCLLVVVFSAVWAPVARITAAESDLDASFGEGGKVVTGFNNGWDESIHSIALQPDGKILAVGYGESLRGADFALARYHSDGTLDASFGQDGKVTRDVSSSPNEGYSVALQADGKIVVAGKTSLSLAVGTLLRFTTNGLPDPDFGTQGVLNVPSVWGFTSMGIQHDGKIVAAGERGTVRVNSDGSLDTTFGNNGFVPELLKVNALAIQPDGKIVLAGYVQENGAYDCAVGRLQTNGVPDGSFAVNGLLRFSFSPDFDQATSVALQKDGKIVIAGEALYSSFDFLVGRITTNGVPDGSFNEVGMQTKNIRYSDSAFAIAIEPGGKILVAGESHYRYPPVNYDMVLVRYNSDGTEDLTLSQFGYVATDFGAGSDEVAQALVLQPDGKILVGGRARPAPTSLNLNPPYDFALVRYTGGFVPPPAIEIKTSVVNGRLNLSWTGAGEQLYEVRATADFINWETVATIQASDSNVVWEDQEGTNQRASRFYLVRQL